MKKYVVQIVLITLFIGIGAFFGGIQYQKMQGRNGFRQSNNGQVGNGVGRNRQGGRPVIGEIIAKDDKSMTVKMTDGSSRIVILSDSMTVSKSLEGTKSDVKVGEKVGVFGTDNTDGSMTAQTIQLNPQFRGMMGR